MCTALLLLLLGAEAWVRPTVIGGGAGRALKGKGKSERSSNHHGGAEEHDEHEHHASRDDDDGGEEHDEHEHHASRDDDDDDDDRAARRAGDDDADGRRGYDGRACSAYMAARGLAGRYVGERLRIMQPAADCPAGGGAYGAGDCFGSFEAHVARFANCTGASAAASHARKRPLVRDARTAGPSSSRASPGRRSRPR